MIKKSLRESNKLHSAFISGLLLGVNPFDQPGVEAYKTNMFALLGKPGFEAQKAELIKRLSAIGQESTGRQLQ